MIALLGAFIVYQLYRLIAVRVTLGLVLLTAFDACVVWLTWREYGAKRAHRERQLPPRGPGPQPAERTS